VLVNGTALNEPYVTRRDAGSMKATQIAPDSYFVLGDNRRGSLDSRDWGPVPSKNIIGRAFVGFWPLDRWHALRVFTPPAELSR
jgi:signal peptidase I